MSSLLSFEAEQRRRRAFTRRDAGTRLVEVARIVGSVGRAGQLDRRFRYRGIWPPRGTEQRKRRLHVLFDRGSVPPLELYAIGEELFVVDGHHRVAVALERGQLEIEAHIVEYLPDRVGEENQLFHERRAFVQATGLREVVATELGRYPRLISRIRDFRHERDQPRGRVSLDSVVLGLPFVNSDGSGLRPAARAWRQIELEPVIDALRAQRIDTLFAGRGEGDLVGYVLDHRWYMGERFGFDVGLDAALQDFVRRHPAEPASPWDVLRKLMPDIA